VDHQKSSNTSSLFLPMLQPSLPHWVGGMIVGVAIHI
jgi:hypothetical protein